MNLSDLRPDPRGIFQYREGGTVADSAERWNDLLGQAGDEELLTVAVRPHYTWRDVARNVMRTALAARALRAGRRPI